jgi:hypothetical protein
MKKFTKYLAVLTLLFFVSVNGVFAGGFPLRPGRFVISPSVAYFFADSKWDSVGVKKPFGNNGQFTSVTISVYSEYGLSRRFALVATLPYSINKFEQSNFSSSYSGLTDLETGLRFYLGNINYKYYFSLQGTVITPLYAGTNLGYHESGGELKLAFAGGGHLFGKSYYFTLEDGVRQYFGSAGPIQDRYNGSFGLTLDKKFREQISIAISGFYSTSNNKEFNILNPTNSRNFAFNQVSLSYGHTFNKHSSLFLSGGHFITGRNTGDGLTASLAYIYRIDR